MKNRITAMSGNAFFCCMHLASCMYLDWGGNPLAIGKQAEAKARARRTIPTGSGLFSVSSVPDRIQIGLFLKKGLLQLCVFRVGTYLPTPGFKGHRHRETLGHLLTGIQTAGRAGLNPFIRAAFHHLVAAPVFRLAAGAGNLSGRDDAVPVAYFHPEFRGMPALLFGFLKRRCGISGTGGTVVSAGSDDFVRHGLSLPFREFPESHSARHAHQRDFSEVLSVLLPQCRPGEYRQVRIRRAHEGGGRFYRRSCPYR